MMTTTMMIALQKDRCYNKFAFQTFANKTNIAQHTNIMQFSSSSLIAAALLLFPTASSSASTMQVYNCQETDQACIATYSTAMSDWGKQFGNDASAQSDACNAMAAGSTESIACWNAALGGLFGTATNDTAVTTEDIDVEDLASKDDSSSSSLLRSTTTSITAAIRIVMAATVLVVA